MFRRGNPFVRAREETSSTHRASHLHAGHSLSWPSHVHIQPNLLKSCQPLQQQRYKPEKEFNLKHLKSIKVDGSWDDCAQGFNFMGRIAFTSLVKESLQWLKVNGPSNVKDARALIYSL